MIDGIIGSERNECAPDEARRAQVEGTPLATEEVEEVADTHVGTGNERQYKCGTHSCSIRARLVFGNP